MRFYFLFILSFTIYNIGYTQLLLRIVDIPETTPLDASIFIAGNFQGWNPGDTNYQLMKTGMDSFELEIFPASGILEFKFTRGSWETVEGNSSGGTLPNRTYQYNEGKDTIELAILSWEDQGGNGNISTAQENVHIINENFYIPQLDRNRRIWIYLPPDYETSEKNYPVLYIHDGQNIFDSSTSFSGEWEVDESLNQLFETGDYGVIVVAIDNGKSHRIDEYSPWINEDYGGGEGDAYMEFIVHTLKPHIDSQYRTLPGREYTGLMGSSMGGLITLYGGTKHQDIFSKLGIFSPSYWFSDEVYTHVSSTGKKQAMKIYTIIGETEGSSGANNVNAMEDTFLNSGFTEEELEKHIHTNGQHSEWYWAREFKAAYEWLFGELGLTSDEQTALNSIAIFPNPTSKILHIDGIEDITNLTVEIFQNDGKLISRNKMTSNQIDVHNLPEGQYNVKIYKKDTLLFAGNFIHIK